MKITKIIIYGILIYIGKLNSQVLIGPNGTIATPHPTSTLELSDSTKGLLLPRMNNLYMDELTGSAPNGLFIYNKDINAPYYFHKPESVWKRLSTDTSMWQTVPLENRIFFKPALSKGDSIFYNPFNRRFIFSDNLSYFNSLGSPFNSDLFLGKYIFKNTLSKADTFRNLHTNMLLIAEFNDGIVKPNDFVFTNLALTTNNNPISGLKNKMIVGVDNNMVNGSMDSVEALIPLRNSITLRPTSGYIGTAVLNENTFLVSGNRTEGLGAITGLRTRISSDTISNYNIQSVTGSLITIDANTAKKVNGSIFGSRIDVRSQLKNSIGTTYGLLIENVGDTINEKASYSIFSRKGNVRFGDSVIISKNISDLLPRAIVDIKSTESMIIPAGTNLQKPVSNAVGQLRYNTDEKQLEFYSGTDWSGIRSDTSTITVNLAANSETIYQINFPGVKVGDIVIVNPVDVSLPPGIIIAWSNIVTSDLVAIKVNNISAASISGSYPMRMKAIR